MTATQMYYSFLDMANAANTGDLRTWVVARWLNQAQQQLWNELMYPDDGKRGDAAPPVAYQKEFKYATDMAPFEVTLPSPQTAPPPATNNKGFWPFPAGLQILTEVAITTDGCNGKPPIIEVKYLRDSEYAATRRNSITRPEWGPKWYVPYFVLDNANPGDNAQTQGLRILPNDRVYQMYIRYLRLPVAIEIENTAEETAWWGSVPSFVTTPADVDCEFPAYRHQEIVDRAVALYFKSSPDYQGFTNEAGAVANGLT